MESMHGDRGSIDMVAWVEEHMKQNLRIFGTREEATQAFEGFERAIIGCFPNKTCPEYHALSSAVLNIREGDVWIAIVNETIEKPTLEHLTIALNISHYFDKPWNLISIVMWIGEWVIPIVGEITPLTAGYYLNSPLPVAFVFVDTARIKYDLMRNDTSYNNITVMRRALVPLATKLEGKMKFTVIDHHENWRFTQTVGPTGKVFPTLSILVPYTPAAMEGAKAHYPYTPTTTPAHLKDMIEEGMISPPVDFEDIEKFCTDFVEGKVPLVLRSLPVPTEQNSRVLTVVGDTFNQTVFHQDKYVFMKFFAPWCAKCKKLSPKFLALAEELKDDPRVVFAEFDVTQNDFYPGIVADAFPTLLLFFPGDEIKVKQCDKFYDMKNVRTFLRDNIPNLDINVDVPDEDETEHNENHASTPSHEQKQEL